jgi:hypothetical protein
MGRMKTTDVLIVPGSLVQTPSDRTLITVNFSSKTTKV